MRQIDIKLLRDANIGQTKTFATPAGTIVGVSNLRGTYSDSDGKDGLAIYLLEEGTTFLHVCSTAIEQAFGGGIPFDPTALLGQQNKGKIGPFRLMRQPLCQGMQVGGAHALLGQDGEARPVFQFGDEITQTHTNMRPHARVAQDRLRDRCVAPTGS